MRALAAMAVLSALAIAGGAALTAKPEPPVEFSEAERAAILLGPEVLACTVPEGFARLATPEAEIAYRWEPGVLKVGQVFAAEVIACRAPGAGMVREVVLDAQMPAHGHGMNYRPATTQLAPDRFRVTGLMLHMPGRWRLTFDLVHAGRRTRLSQDVDLKP